MKTFATIVITASLALGSVFAVSAPASAAPIAQIEIARPSDVVQVRDDRYWRHHHRDWHRNGRYWHHGRGDWRRDHWRHDRYWHHHRRHGVVIRF